MISIAGTYVAAVGSPARDGGAIAMGTKTSVYRSAEETGLTFRIASGSYLIKNNNFIKNIIFNKIIIFN